MTVITLSRELGSRGDDIAFALSERLGVRIAGRDVINRAAKATGAPEIALAEIDELGLLGVRRSAATAEAYLAKVATIIYELAEAGNVLIVGRGGQVVLAGRPEVLHVRVIAPLEQRVSTVMAGCHISHDAAAARVEASDHARAALLRRSHQERWDDPLLYDLVLNMRYMTVSDGVETICSALKNRALKTVATGREAKV